MMIITTDVQWKIDQPTRVGRLRLLNTRLAGIEAQRSPQRTSRDVIALLLAHVVPVSAGMERVCTVRWGLPLVDPSHPSQDYTLNEAFAC
jgi:hypothetical protein